ncbi:hypothetical protein D9M69_575030 [compost metagenome]
MVKAGYRQEPSSRVQAFGCGLGPSTATLGARLTGQRAQGATGLLQAKRQMTPRPQPASPGVALHTQLAREITQVVGRDGLRQQLDAGVVELMRFVQHHHTGFGQPVHRFGFADDLV